MQDVELYGPTRHVYDRHQEIPIPDPERIVSRAIDQGEIVLGTPRLWAELLGVMIRRLRDPEVLDRLGASRGEALDRFGHLCRRGLSWPRRGR